MVIFRQGLKLLVILAVLGLLLFPATALSQGPMVGPTAGKLAVTPAGYDNMADVLGKLGFSAKEIQESDLADLSNLEDYDALYLNCSGSIDGVAENAAKAIGDYVKGGGIVYASDYANSLITKAFPGKINFFKGSPLFGVEEEVALSSRVGAPGKVQAKVTDVGLAAVLGKQTIEVNYDLGAWAVIDNVGSGGRVLMTGPAPIIDFQGMTKADPQAWQAMENLDFSNPQAIEEFAKKFYKTSQTLENKPYVVAFSEGKGEVLYTTFHNEAQVTADVKSVLNWFAVRAKAGKLARATQELLSGGNDEILQEMVDGINQGETKQYLFNASGAGDFQVSLNFGGSALNLLVLNPKGKTVLSQKVDQPPFTSKVKAAKGQFTLKVEGVDVSEQNMPFVLTIAGPAKAASANIATKQPGLNFGSRSVKLILVGLGIVIIVGAIVVVITRRQRQGKKNV